MYISPARFHTHTGTPRRVSEWQKLNPRPPSHPDALSFPRRARALFERRSEVHVQLQCAGGQRRRDLRVGGGAGAHSRGRCGPPRASGPEAGPSKSWGGPGPMQRGRRARGHTSSGRWPMISHGSGGRCGRFPAAAPRSGHEHLGLPRAGVAPSIAAGSKGTRTWRARWPAVEPAPGRNVLRPNTDVSHVAGALPLAWLARDREERVARGGSARAAIAPGTAPGRSAPWLAAA